MILGKITPSKMTPWAPYSRGKSLKTTEEFLICVYLMYEVQEMCIDIDLCLS